MRIYLLILKQCNISFSRRFISLPTKYSIVLQLAFPVFDFVSLVSSDFTCVDNRA